MAKSSNLSVKKLTAAQQVALDRLKSFLSSSNSFFRLDGYAGTGKSFLICHLMEWLESHELAFVVAAPTNKAAKNLEQVAISVGITVDVKTVAQLLGQQPEINEETGQEEFTTNNEAEFDDYDVVIIDEFSMIDRSNFDAIIDAVNLTIDTKIIFVGDSAQLPPVKEDNSIVASSEHIDDSATLDEIVRYDGEIAIAAEAIRTQPKYQTSLYPFESSSDKTIVCQPRKEWLETVIDYFKSDNYRANPDYVRLLVWKNKTAASANKFVRSRLWGKDAPAYVPGDRLITKKPLFRPRPGKRGKNKWGIAINNSEECTVTELPKAKTVTHDKHTYTCLSLPVITDRGTPFNLSILTEESQQYKSERIQYYVDKKQWNKYFDLSRMFDDVTYSYGLTVHKAQGSSIEYVFLDTEDLQYCPDLQKMLYTALTRTKIRVFIPV
ncbi:MAG: AAA family ATPase [Cyanobacteria bacterium P01_G01_bin.19]